MFMQCQNAGQKGTFTSSFRRRLIIAVQYQWPIKRSELELIGLDTFDLDCQILMSQPSPYYKVGACAGLKT